MKRTHVFIIALLLILVGIQTSWAAPRAWKMDRAHAGIFFSVPHIFSKVNGHFADFDVTMYFDPHNVAESSFVFTIKVKSIDTAIGKRDKHLLSEDFFDASEYPVMKFVSKKVMPEKNGVYNIVGTLTVKGEDYDFTLPLTFAGIKEHPMKKGTDVIGFNGMFTLDRLAYDIGDGTFADMGVVGKEVDVFVTLEALSKQ